MEELINYLKILSYLIHNLSLIYKDILKMELAHILQHVHILVVRNLKHLSLIF